MFILEVPLSFHLIRFLSVQLLFYKKKKKKLVFDAYKLKNGIITLTNLVDNSADFWWGTDDR